MNVYIYCIYVSYQYTSEIQNKRHTTTHFCIFWVKKKLFSSGSNYLNIIYYADKYVIDKSILTQFYQMAS